MKSVKNHTNIVRVKATVSSVGAGEGVPTIHILRMKNLKTETKTIAGKEYEYTECPRCGIWVQAEHYPHPHKGSPECDKWLKARPHREAMTRKVLGIINKLL